MLILYFLFLSQQNYFGDAWNILDFIIVVGSIVDIIASKLLVSQKYRVLRYPYKQRTSGVQKSHHVSVVIRFKHTWVLCLSLLYGTNSFVSVVKTLDVKFLHFRLPTTTIQSYLDIPPTLVPQDIVQINELTGLLNGFTQNCDILSHLALIFVWISE